MVTPPEPGESYTWWGLGGSLVAAVLMLRRRLSRDKVGLKKDEAEVDIIKVLQQERDLARKGEAEARRREELAWEARNKDAKLIGELTSQVQHQTQIIQTLEKQVHQLRQELHGLRDQLKAQVIAAGQKGKTA